MRSIPAREEEWNENRLGQLRWRIRALPSARGGGRLEELAADLAATPEAGPAVCPEHVADGSGGE